MKRRDFIKYGISTLGGVGLTYGNLNISYANEKYAPKFTPNDNSVIFLFLGGGASHIETFNPIPNAPVERRSVTGHIDTSVPGMKLGGLFTELGKRADKITVFHGFYHKDSNHSTATNWMIGGQKNQGGSAPNYPSYGSMVARCYGPTTAPHNIPTYIKLGKIDGDGSAWLNKRYMGYEANALGIQDLKMKYPKAKMDRRFQILKQLQGNQQPNHMYQGWGELQDQAFDVITGKAAQSFTLEGDPEFDNYKDHQLGKDILTAMRVIENGAKLATINFGGWDMHSNILGGLNARQTVLDTYLGKLLDSLEKRGLSEKTMLVVTSEFGRTPKVNANSGRDHWSNSVPLMISNASYDMGRIVGATNPTAEFADAGLCTPKDLRWTILNHVGLQKNNTWWSTLGRPMPVISNDEKNILTDIKA